MCNDHLETSIEYNKNREKKNSAASLMCTLCKLDDFIFLRFLASVRLHTTYICSCCWLFFDVWYAYKDYSVYQCYWKIAFYVLFCQVQWYETERNECDEKVREMGVPLTHIEWKSGSGKKMLGSMPYTLWSYDCFLSTTHACVC